MHLFIISKKTTNYLTDFLQNYFDLSEFNQKMNNISEPCRNRKVEFVQALRNQKLLYDTTNSEPKVV